MSAIITARICCSPLIYLGTGSKDCLYVKISCFVKELLLLLVTATSLTILMAARRNEPKTSLIVNMAGKKHEPNLTTYNTYDNTKND